MRRVAANKTSSGEGTYLSFISSVSSVGSGVGFASEEAKADAEAKPTPEPTEDTEEMNDRYVPSPDEVLFAATRLIPDGVYIQRHNLDSVAVAIFRAGEQELTVVAR